MYREECSCKLFKDRAQYYRLRYLQQCEEMDALKQANTTALSSQQEELLLLRAQLRAREEEVLLLKQQREKPKEVDMLREVNAKFAAEIARLNSLTKPLQDEICRLNARLDGETVGDHNAELRSQLNVAAKQQRMYETALKVMQTRIFELELPAATPQKRKLKRK